MDFADRHPGTGELTALFRCRIAQLRAWEVNHRLTSLQMSHVEILLQGIGPLRASNGQPIILRS